MADDCRDSFSTNQCAHLFCGDGVVYVTQQQQWSSASCLTIQLGGTIQMVPPLLGFALGKKLELCHHNARSHSQRFDVTSYHDVPGHH